MVHVRHVGKFEVKATNRNSDYPKRGVDLVWYVDGPGSPGPHGYLLQPELYHATAEEAEKTIPRLQSTYSAAYSSAQEAMRAALGLT